MFPSHKPITIKIADSESENHSKHPRKGLKTLQRSATEKENLTGRPIRNLKDHLITKHQLDDLEKKCKKRSKQTQANLDTQITEDDLTNEAGPSENYWKILAEKTKAALQEALEENEELHKLVDDLKEKNEVYKTMLEEANSFVESFKEMLDDNNDTGIDVKDISTADEASYSETNNPTEVKNDLHQLEETQSTSEAQQHNESHSDD